MMQAAAQAAELDRRLNLRTNVENAAKYTLVQAQELTNRALQNPKVAQSVTAAKEFVSQAVAAVQQTYQQAQVEVRNIDARLSGRPVATPSLPQGPAQAAFVGASDPTINDVEAGTADAGAAVPNVPDRAASSTHTAQAGAAQQFGIGSPTPATAAAQEPESGVI
jgi:hypothetical protein